MTRKPFSEKLNNLVSFDLVSARDEQDAKIISEDLMEQLEGQKTSSLFMGQYTLERIEGALERFNILGKIKRLGYEDLQIKMHPRSPYEHRLTIRDTAAIREQRESLLGEIIIKEGYFRPKISYIDIPFPQNVRLIFIEWILMQRPGAPFTDQRSQLPGQNWPGLGVGREVMDLLLWVSRNTKIDGILNVPEFFHNGYFYSEQFFFYNPEKQAELNAIFNDLTKKGLNISDISFAVYFDCIFDQAKQKPYNWMAEEQICPLSGDIKEYFEHSEYRQKVNEIEKELHFDLDRERFEKWISTKDKIEW